MSVVKSVLAASAILGTLGLAGCQTTEERVYYSEVSEPAPTTWVYEDGPRWRSPPPRVYVQPAPVWADREFRYRERRPPPPPPPPPPRWSGPPPGAGHHWQGGPPPSAGNRWQGGPPPGAGSHWQGGPPPSYRRDHRQPGLFSEAPDSSRGR